LFHHLDAIYESSGDVRVADNSNSIKPKMDDSGDLL
jgi:hypothetical protein